MYLTVKQHDSFRTLLMGFEIPFRKYVADVITKEYNSAEAFENAMRNKNSILSPSSPDYLKDVLPKACKANNLKQAFTKFQTATSSIDEIVMTDIEIPMVGALNLVTFALVEHFGDLYSLFGSYDSYCKSAELYRYSRNKLDHPGSRTLEDSHLVPVLSFIKDICAFLDNSCFLQKTKEQIMAEVTALQQRKTVIPVKIQNFVEMPPYGDSRIVCRDSEIQRIKDFVYGKPEDLRKQHSCCIYGYGGVGKTALVIEVLKQIVGDIQDGLTINEYEPQYILFFSAKKRRLTLESETDRFVEQPMKSHFESADELIELILYYLRLNSLRHFKDEGIVVIDNLETLPPEERKKVKSYVETQTPSEMQFILTSRYSEEYEVNYKLAGFDSEIGKEFIKEYSLENSLDIDLSDDDAEQLLSLAKGNTLVLVLSMRRLSRSITSIGVIKAEFDLGNAWKSIRSALSKTPSNAYEVIAEFMFKDTFEHIEETFKDNVTLFYKVLKVFAVIQNENTDISTLCLLTNESYPDVEAVVNILCNYLILEKNDTQYSLNEFAEKFIVVRFLPDAATYEQLSKDILSRQRQVNDSLNKLKEDIKTRPWLKKIITDWLIISDVDQISAAEMYNLYEEVKKACYCTGKFKVESVLEEFVKKCNEAEQLTAHPFIKYQKARILIFVDQSKILPYEHIDSIKRGFGDAVYSIKTIEQYSGIQQTKSYASLLWLYGQYLSQQNDLSLAMRYLEESKASFEEQKIKDQEYYKCVAQLGCLYTKYYSEDRQHRMSYLRDARQINRELSNNWCYLDKKARSSAGFLNSTLRSLGDY